MTVTPDSPWRHPPRISLERFERILGTRGNIGILRERPASEYYNAIVNKGVDPCFILAKFHHESSLGTAGVAATTKSWGNTRTPNFGAIPIGTADGRSGTFPIWASWLDGCKSTVERLVTHEWVYFDRETIREIYEHPSGKVWAPAGDLNNPAGYLRAVIDFMNENEDVTMAAQIPGFKWQPADSRHFTQGRTKRISGGAQHYTGGINSLAYLSTNPTTNVSATFLVKHNPTLEDRGWQLVKIEDTAHTTGEIVNPKTISIEYEHMGMSDIPDIAYEVMAMTWFESEQYALAHNLGDFRESIKGHKTWVGDNRVCPDGIDVARIVRRFNELKDGPPPPDDVLLLDGNPYGAFGFRLGFQAWAKAIGNARNPADITAGALSVTGWPKENQWEGVDGNAYQRAERLTLQYNPDNSVPFDVVVLRCDDVLPAAA